MKITLARDLPVGPRGGVKRANETVDLPVSQATELLHLGHARRPDGTHPDTAATSVPADNDAAQEGTE